MGFLCYCLDDQCLARRPNPGEGKPTSRSSFFFFSDWSLAYTCPDFQFWHIVGPICLGLVGFVISISTEVVAARYVALFLQASSYAGFIVFYSWLSSSFPRPPAKRAVAIAMVNAFSQLGNIAGSYVWQMPENGFRKSYGIVIAMFGVTIAGCFWFRQILVGLNKKIEAAEQAAEAEGPVDTHKRDQIHVEGDAEISGLQRGFRYLV